MRRSSLAIMGGALLTLCLLGWPGNAQAAVVERASVATGGAEADGRSYYPSISADGRFVAFQSAATNLVPGDTNGVDDIFVRDRQTGITERVSVSSAGTQADGESSIPWISAEGRFVVFQSGASNLVSGDTNGTIDVFVHDRQTGITEQVSTGAGGVEANNVSYPRGVSADGRYVVFISDASNLIPGDTNATCDIFVRDRQTGITERVNVGSAGAQSNAASWDCAISADGRFVAFQSAATNLVPGDTNGADDIFLHDRLTGTTSRASVRSDGTEANGPSYAPSLSADGRYVAFPSDASNLVPGDTNGRRDVFVYDRDTGATKRVSVSGGGGQADRASGYPAISIDGRYVAFQSYANNLVSGDTGLMDVFVHDRETGTTERVSVTKDGDEADAESSAHLSISGNGRYVAFISAAGNLVPGDMNGVDDVFVAETTPEGSFSDIARSPYGAAIEGLAQARIVSGYGDRTFRPSNPVLRAQFAKMIVLALGLPVTEGGVPLPFSDVARPSDDLYPDDYVAVAAANGLVAGYGGGIFKPYLDITRAQVITMVVRAAERLKPAAVPEPPAGWQGVLLATDATHGANIARAEYAGLLAGIDLSTFSPYAKATRGEAAQIAWNLKQK